MDIVLRRCALLRLETGEIEPDRCVRIEGDRIVEVGGPDLRSGAAGELDCGGRTLMPGLIDAHVHAMITTMNLAAMAQRPLTLVAIEAAKVLEGMLRRGFTSVRDAGGADRGMAQAVERGLIAGPRLFYSGRALSQTGGHGDFGPLEEIRRRRQQAAIAGGQLQLQKQNRSQYRSPGCQRPPGVPPRHFHCLYREPRRETRSR